VELLAILIALALFGLWGGGGAIQQDGWFTAFHQWLSRWSSGAALQLAAVLLPAAAIGLLHGWVDSMLFGLPSLALLVLVLLYSFGRGNLGATVAEYLERWSRGDFQAAWTQLDAGAVPGDGTVSQPAELHAIARRRYYYRAFERLFAVLFWFVTLGPAGAVAYRLAALESERAGERERTLPLLLWIEWIPVRLLGISYALVGDFDACIHRWHTLLDDGHTSADVALENCGNAALRLDTLDVSAESPEALIARGAREIESIEVLHRRALLVWMVIIAMLVMIA
jgi:AmpE protein